MRAFRSFVLALAVVAAASTASVFAQGNSAKTAWSVVPVKQLPVDVRTGSQRVIGKARVIKVEQSGTGATAIYRLTVQYKGKPTKMLFDAKGKSID